MGEIADDHMSQIWWDEGLDYEDGPPCDSPDVGGFHNYIARRISAPANSYRCKYCGDAIGFINRRPYNPADGSLHECLKNRRRAVVAAAPTAQPNNPSTSDILSERKRQELVEQIKRLNTELEALDAARAQNPEAA